MQAGSKESFFRFLEPLPWPRSPLASTFEQDIDLVSVPLLVPPLEAASKSAGSEPTHAHCLVATTVVHSVSEPDNKTYAASATTNQGN